MSTRHAWGRALQGETAFYSSLRAAIGSWREARRAGRYPAVAATRANTAEAMESVKVSVDFIPYKKDSSRWVVANAATRPMAKPTPIRMATSLSTMFKTLDCSAPRAMRMPISLRLLATLYDITP